MRKRLVRIHLKGDLPSIEGVIRTWATWGTWHYTVRLAKVVEGEQRTFTLEGDKVRIPRENVAFVQVLTGVAA